MPRDVIDRIRDFNEGREPERLIRKYGNMRRDPFVFLRGSCHLFYDRLPSGSVPRDTPTVWLCGDLHLQNFGSYKGDNRLAYFDVNDFDEAALGPASWDVLRLATSVFLAADGLKLRQRDARTLCAGLVDAYGQALAGGKARWIERDVAQGLIRQLLDSVRDRPRRKFLDSRTTARDGIRRIDVDGRHALPMNERQRRKVEKFMARFAATQAEPAFFRVLDAARRIAGTGSLGVERYVILVEGKGSPDQNFLLDLKEALPSSLLPHLKARPPRWPSEAHRVVALQRRLQAVPMAFLQPVRIGRRSYVLRALQPTEDRVALDAPLHDSQALAGTLDAMGGLIAWMHLRSAGREGSAIADELIEFGQRARWRMRVVEAAEECAAIARSDWKRFCRAYDDGGLTPPG